VLAALPLLLSIAQATSASPNAHYLVFEVDGADLRPVFHRLVRLAKPPVSIGEERAIAGAAPRPSEDEVFDVRLVAPGGRTVHHGTVSVPRFGRVELPHGPGGRALEGARVEKKRRAFTVRVPLVPGVKLRLGSSITRAVREFDLESLASDPSLAIPDALADPAVVPLQSTGSPANRVDVLFVGDGYTAEQSAQFAADAASLGAQLLAVTPYAEYASAVNLAALFTPSAQSGTDHPPYSASCTVTTPPTCCAEGGDPLAGTFVSTAFNSSFCADNIQRQLYVDTALVEAAASAYPDWDLIVVLVNDPTYGGYGGEITIVSLNASVAEVLRHEYGHSFTLLADEYTNAYPGFPACSDIDGPACEPNVTDQTNPALLKWAPWVLPSTPIPTPVTAPYADVVGLFEGARFLASGMYRSKQVCRMAALGIPFCEVCRQEYVLRLYRGGWGVPAAGIDAIEPGSESPTPGDVSAACATGATLSATLLEPSGGPALEVTWLVDGVVQAGETSATFNFHPRGTGPFTVEMHVHDPTPFVNATMAAGSLDWSRTWTVTATLSDGDVNGDCAVDVLDVFALVNALFAGGPAPVGVADVNGDGHVDVLDVFYLIDFLFAGGSPPK
jgi:hypothetical protein